ncbi:hypothetical protein K4M64_004522 [Salmonella enterica]|nr:hypothetical protein [Salmonella enterica]
MKHKEIFDKYFTLDPDSPTGIYYKGTDYPAGYKQKSHGNYVWVVSRRGKIKGISRLITWSLPRVLYELSHNVEIDNGTMISYVDGNRDNLSIDNLIALPMNRRTQQQERNLAFDNYRNVILSRLNPDYFKDPKDWTNPEALAALDMERERRKQGISKKCETLGAPQKWI